MALFVNRRGKMKTIVLASKSPRRHELLEMVRVEHVVLTSDCDENISETDPAAFVTALSARKAEATAERIASGKEADPAFPEGALVVGADTIVYFEGTILGKPKDAEDAVRMLSAMSGKRHTVYTGVTLIDTESGRRESFCEQTDVFFYPVSEEEIRRYVATGDPLDKAGSYGVQGLGAFLVKRIEGDYYTVVGFPIAHFLQILKNF